MDRKDLFSLMEAYDDVVLDKEFAPEDELEQGTGEEISLGDTAELPEGDIENSGVESHHDVSHDELEHNEEEKKKMVEAHLHTLRSHAHEIHGCIENGANIEPWMEEKIAIANDYIVHVANAIMYRK
jgi:hypothetical protein